MAGPGTIALRDHCLLVTKPTGESGKIPLEDMAVLVLDGPDLSLSHQTLSACASAGVAVVTSDGKHLPNGLLLPLSAHSLHTSILQDQIGSKVPNKKRAWQEIVKSKIQSQADNLRLFQLSDNSLRKLIPFVRSGDPDNIEARAAARYFEAMFGSDFIRDRDANGINACLNYGYSLARSAVARAIVAAGLHPALGIHHHNQYNPFCLADDAMEPLRAIIDRRVRYLAASSAIPEELDSKTKRELISLLGSFVEFDGLRYPLLVGLERYAVSLRRAICYGDSVKVPMPEV